MNLLHRYTNIAATIHLLRTKRITLLNPATWDDGNDAHFMAEYKRIKGAKTVLGLCFAHPPQGYHFWRVFSHGGDGVCIEFDKSKLLSTFDRENNTRHSEMQYTTIDKIKELPHIPLEDLPFLKGYRYREEREYRIVYVGMDKEIQFKNYEINLGWINRITLSPWMPKVFVDSVKSTLKSIDGCSGIKVSWSTLVDSEAWKEQTARVR